MSSTEAAPKKGRNWWPIGIVGSLVVFVAFMLAVVTATTRFSSDVVSKQYYEEGYNLSRCWRTKPRPPRQVGRSR